MIVNCCNGLLWHSSLLYNPLQYILYVILLQVGSYPSIPWSTKHPKMAQPDLDFIAPEIQLQACKTCSPQSDMFSLGMTVCAVYNRGHSLIVAGHNTAIYAKKIEQVLFNCPMYKFKHIVGLIFKMNEYY